MQKTVKNVTILIRKQFYLRFIQVYKVVAQGTGKSGAELYPQGIRKGTQNTFGLESKEDFCAYPSSRKALSNPQELMWHLGMEKALHRLWIPSLLPHNDIYNISTERKIMVETLHCLQHPL